MAFNESTTVSHPPQQVFEGLLNQEFQVSVAESLNATVDSFRVEPANPDAADPVSVVIDRSVDGEELAKRLPSAVQRFVRGRVQIAQSDTWSTAQADGSRVANISIEIPLAKATGTATMKLVPTQDGTHTVVETEGSVVSGIPLMGSRIAAMAEPQVGKILTTMAKRLDAWLADR